MASRFWKRSSRVHQALPDGKRRILKELAIRTPDPMRHLQQAFEKYLPSIEAEMRAALDAEDPGNGELFNILRYHLGWVDSQFQPCAGRAGKRLRPVMCLLAYEACGGEWTEALPAAAAVELLHNFTLIHDDIEDKDRFRRGRPTVWSLWGGAQGVNAGDTLFSVSQLTLLRLRERGAPAEAVLKAVQLFNETCVALTHGQYMDIGFESRPETSVEEYLTMIEGKTAALVACSCELGALVSRAPNDIRQGLRSFGRHVGLAFQMQDDVLGIWGDSDVTGKPVGSDIARGKKTLPVLHGLERSAELQALLAGLRLEPDGISRARELLEETGSRAYAEALARSHYGRALQALEVVTLRSPAVDALRQLARNLVHRSR